jgi:hypothetical protein
VAGRVWNDRFKLRWFFEGVFARMPEILWFCGGENVVKCVVNVVRKQHVLAGGF